MSDENALATPRQIRAGRALMGWNQTELAQAADVGWAPLARLEQGKGIARRSTILRIQAALERGDETGRVEFIPATGGKWDGVRLLPPLPLEPAQQE
jgi:predicted transcriptional regulator